MTNLPRFRRYCVMLALLKEVRWTGSQAGRVQGDIDDDSPAANGNQYPQAARHNTDGETQHTTYWRCCLASEQVPLYLSTT